MSCFFVLFCFFCLWDPSSQPGIELMPHRPRRQSLHMIPPGKSRQRVWWAPSPPFSPPNYPPWITEVGRITRYISETPCLWDSTPFWLPIFKDVKKQWPPWGISETLRDRVFWVGMGLKRQLACWRGAQQRPRASSCCPVSRGWLLQQSCPAVPYVATSCWLCILQIWFRLVLKVWCSFATQPPLPDLAQWLLSSAAKTPLIPYVLTFQPPHPLPWGFECSIPVLSSSCHPAGWPIYHSSFILSPSLATAWRLYIRSWITCKFLCLPLIPLFPTPLRGDLQLTIPLSSGLSVKLPFL